MTTLTPLRTVLGGTDRGIGVVGCGWAASMQLAAYQAAGFRVVALTDHTASKAEDLRERFFPEATVHPDAEALLADERVEVVDLATHPVGRPALIEQALRSGRHVLGQKPFVEDLDEGARLCDLADRLGRTLAVNANGRWAPHFAALLAAAEEGVLGELTSGDFWVYWPHDGVVEGMTAFSTMSDLVLYDFGIHWFDLVGALFPGQVRAVAAQVASRPDQRIAAPTQAQVLIDYADAQVSLRFRAAERRCEEGGYRVDGRRGTVQHVGGAFGGSRVTVLTGVDEHQSAREVPVEPNWFGPGMAGAMGELLRALDEQRPPRNSGRSALPGLALCFAAVQAAHDGRPVLPGSVRRRPGAPR